MKHSVKNLVTDSLSCLIIQLVIYIVALLLNFASGDSVIFLFYLGHTFFSIYFYVSKKFSLFALPISHIPLPFVLFPLFMFAIGTDSWEFGYTFIFTSVFVILPSMLITLTVSLVIFAIRKAQERASKN